MRLVLSTGEVVFCLCAAAVALYVSPLFLDNGAGVWEFLLIWDDRKNFVENEVIQRAMSLESLYAMFTMTRINVYEPFGWLLKAVQVQTVGLDSWSIRVVSVALHFGAAMVLARAAATLLDVMAILSDIKSTAKGDGRSRDLRERRNWLGCSISAVVFAIHPVHVEVVGWPSAQPYTLCALFSNLALYVYVRAMYWKLREASGANESVKKILVASIFGGYGRGDPLCCVFYLSALLSKRRPLGVFASVGPNGLEDLRSTSYLPHHLWTVLASR
ncbi:Tetratricopeptide-like helical [Phytophthora cinnamomi]|uniref:Tetratricopeptide-like helical n=1 Tax=Phytophthora cinnamomi TaxID=4785 RepID=UPI003559F58F|nr:Tetratricopeptide-like helical [Phytophthora cinnamomi]